MGVMSIHDPLVYKGAHPFGASLVPIPVLIALLHLYDFCTQQCQEH